MCSFSLPLVLHTPLPYALSLFPSTCRLLDKNRGQFGSTLSTKLPPIFDWGLVVPTRYRDRRLCVCAAASLSALWPCVLCSLHTAESAAASAWLRVWSSCLWRLWRWCRCRWWRVRSLAAVLFENYFVLFLLLVFLFSCYSALLMYCYNYYNSTKEIWDNQKWLLRQHNIRAFCWSVSTEYFSVIYYYI